MFIKLGQQFDNYKASKYNRTKAIPSDASRKRFLLHILRDAGQDTVTKRKLIIKVKSTLNLFQMGRNIQDPENKGRSSFVIISIIN